MHQGKGESPDQGELLEWLTLGSPARSVPDSLESEVDLGFAKLDLARGRRTGWPEVVFGEGKSAEQIGQIVGELGRRGQRPLVTRVDAAKAEAVRVGREALVYDSDARTLSIPQAPRGRHRVALLSAGTSDRPVAREAFRTLEAFGQPCQEIYDVGVSGLHRMLRRLPEIQEASVVIVCAGMEGALVSVVGGLVRAPVIAVPTSVGYGVAKGGYAALLGMLTSCSSGTTVCNIDNGFGAAMAALRILSLASIDGDEEQESEA